MEDSVPLDPPPPAETPKRQKGTYRERHVARGRSLSKLYPNRKSIAEKENISDLPRWARMALVEYETQELTYEEVAEKYGRSKSTLEQYGRSPAGKKWRKQCAAVADDPIRMTEIMLRASATGVTVDYLMALQSAIDASDYREVGVMSRDILDRLGVKKHDKASQTVKPVIHISLGAGVSLDAPTVSTRLELPAGILDADWEEDAEK